MILALFLALLLWQAPAPAPQNRLAEVQQKLKRVDDVAVARELLAQADRDPDPAVRRLILDRVGRLPLPEARAALERHAAEDPDPAVAMAALERLRLQQARDLGRVFEKRLALARSQNDARAVEVLTAEHQRWATLAAGAILPAFLQHAPPVFDAVPSKASVRVAAFGDSGIAGPDQRDAAAAVIAYHKRRPFDMGVVLGDTFDPVGVAGPSDPRWDAEWHELYRAARIPFFAVTGNHDWGLGDSPAAEIFYSAQSPIWRMPALYYTFRAGPAQFFALATQAMSQTQLQWLDRELGRSTARWKIVYGHHPIYSYGSHGDTPQLQKTLLPLLKNRADMYIAGHDHTPQHLKPEGGVHFLVTTAAGQKARPAARGPNTLFTDSFYGFTSLEIDAERLRVIFVDTEGKVRYRTDIAK